MNLLPVAIGGDIGIYALLRDFHTQYGCDAVVLSTNPTRAIGHSSFITNVVNEGINDPATLAQTLITIAHEHPGRTLILLTNADWYVKAILDHRNELAKHYIIPHPSQENFDLVGDKHAFATICHRLSIPTPAEIGVDLSDLTQAQIPAVVKNAAATLKYPLVAKPASSAEYFYINFPGKKKIHHINSEEELATLLGALVTARYQGTFLIQEFITGDETQMRSLTAYRNTRGHVTLAATGRVLLEEHTPGTLGIPAAIMVEHYPEVIDQAIAFLNDINYHGFANFDIKWDTTHHRYVFFEANPRIGRNNYYVTAGGASTARAIVDDYITKDDTRHTAVTPVLYSVVPHRLLMRYVLDDALNSQVRTLIRDGKTVHPLRYSADKSPKRALAIEAMTANFWRKYRQYYPKPTASGF